MDGPPLAFYVPWLTVGGAQRVTVDIANGLAERGHEVHLVLSFKTGDLLEAVSDAVEVIDLNTPRFPVLGLGASIPALASYLSERRPGAVFSQMTYANVVCLLAHRLAGVDVPVFPTEHNTFGMKSVLKERLTYRLAARLYPRAAQVIAVSRGVAESIVEETSLDRNRVSVLLNPVEVERVREQSHAPLEDPWLQDEDIEVVLFVGEMRPQKDMETWIETFREVVDERPGVRGIVAGRGARREAAMELAAELGVRESLSFPGYVENAYAYMRRADVFLLSSRFEGLPTVLIEALACGCPVVSTDCRSGPREILEEGRYGRLAPVGAPRELATAVVETLESPPDRGELQRRADEFAPDVVIDRYEAFLAERDIIPVRTSGRPDSPEDAN